MRFRIGHLLLAITAIAVVLVVFKPQLPSFLADFFLSFQKTTRIVVAGVDLGDGTRIKAENLVLKDWLADAVPRGAMTDIESAVDRVVGVATMRGEPVLTGNVTDKGMHAFTVPAPAAGSTFAGTLSPGSRVDVLLTLKGGRGNWYGGRSVTATLLQHVEILVLDQKPSGQGKSRIPSVVLQVTPAEAARLTQAQKMGTLTLSPSSGNLPKTRNTRAQPSTLPRLPTRYEYYDIPLPRYRELQEWADEFNGRGRR